jgi:hypothetical protein
MTVSRVFIATVTAVIRNTNIPPPMIPRETAATQTVKQISNIGNLVYKCHHISNSLPRVVDVLAAVVPLRVACAFPSASRLRYWQLTVA